MCSSFNLWSICRVAVSHNALLNVEDQRGGAQSPLTLSVLADDSLSEIECTRLCRLGFFLVGFGPVYLDQRRLTPSGFIQGLRSGGRLIMLLGVLLVHLRLFFRALRRALPVAAELVFDQAEGGEIGPFRSRKFLDDLLHPLF